MSRRPTFTSPASRRAFLQRAGWLTAISGSPLVASLATMASSAAAATSDHKALVCVFLNGGNDQSNTVVPVSNAEYAAYQAARPAVALAQSSLLSLSPVGHAGPTLGLHPSLGGLKQLFDAGDCALLANVGTLARPITKTQWNNGDPSTDVPLQLFSHADQQGHWQTGTADRRGQTGWLGRAGDILAPAFNAGSPVSVCFSIAGNNLMQAGAQTVQYQLTAQGTVRLAGQDGFSGSLRAGTVMKRLVTEPRTNLLERTWTATTRRAIESEAAVRAAIDVVNPATAFPSSGLAQQLKMVARLIGARAALGQRRQIFFVSAGGYDFHDNLLVDQAARLQQLGDALKAFHDATVELGVADNVTTFTASDFGRTLLSNGRGADHGWGAHHFIVGGAVRGNRVYGQWPTVALGGPEDAGQGRLIPTTAVDQYAATLARWFGASDLDAIVPNIGRFASSDLGFLA